MIIEIKSNKINELFNDIAEEIYRLLASKNLRYEKERITIKRVKLIGELKEIIRDFIFLLDNYLKEGYLVKNVKLEKIKKIWKEYYNGANEYSVSFTLLLIPCKIQKRLKFLESKKDKVYKVVIEII